MKRVQMGDATLYHGDSLNVMRDMMASGERAALLVSDAPYKLTSGGKGAGLRDRHIPMRGKFDSGLYSNDGNIVVCDLDWSDWLKLAYEVLVDDADAYLMANDKEIFRAWQAAIDAGFKFHNLLPWNKGTVTPNKYYMKQFEFTGYFWKGAARTINDPSSVQGWFQCPPRGEACSHPTQKPVELMQHYIENSSQPGDVVFDPFMGSGTTGVAALRCGRRFVGVEIDEPHFAVACERMGGTRRVGQKDLFAA